MELVYRIQKKEFAQDRNSILSGYGAFLHGGRWNPKGVPMIYTSATPELAALEYKVQLMGMPHDKVPPLVLITIQIPDSIEVAKIETLPPNWDYELKSFETELFTKNWLSKNEFLAMKIPSVVVKKSSNFLINPQNPLIEQVNIIEIEDFSFDRRLFVSQEQKVMDKIVLDIFGFESE